MESVPSTRDSRSAPALRTFLIADVRGYTRFTAEHGDEAAAHLAATFAALARDAVEARGGRVIELRGDEVLAVFDEAAQSVRAALELQWTLAEEVVLDPSLPLLVGIGIAAGEAVPVEEGFRGAALNLAARLCSTAAAGEVLLSEWVARLAGQVDGTVFEGRGTVELKGFPEPVPYLEVSPEGTPPAAITYEVGASVGLPSELDANLPLIGREHEMRWARGTWRQVRRGAGRVLVVSGPSGIGKTRLAAEVAALIEASGGAVRYAGAGGTAIADILASIEAACRATAPTLVILDDLDAAGERAASALAQALQELQRRPVLVLALTQRPDAFPSLGALVVVLDARGDGHRVLEALDLDGVREICRIYAGEEVSEAPVESIARSSGGVPGQVHEVMSVWAREEASRRLEAAAQWLTAGRGQRSAGLGFANNVIGLKLDRIYRVPEAGEETVCPYKGLATYREEDARFFFGRENLVGELAARSVGVGLLGVVGASGSGKSSVVAAGLRSSLAAGLLPGSANWRQVGMRPGEHPMAELNAALGGLAPGGNDDDPIGWATDALGPNERLVLYVDQFEEIFTTCTDEEEAEAFVGALGRAVAAPERAVVVACLRGDFYAHTAAYPTLAEALSSNHVIVGPMSPEELRRAIERPARRAGLRVESALVDRLVEEVFQAPGGLPLLSTALVELWGKRTDGWIRLDAHELTGGLNGAVARLAEQTYGELSDAEKAVSPAVFLRLVGPGEGDAVTRRRVSVDEFDTQSDPAAAEVLRRFTQDRLLSADDRTVEVAHEALLREWPRLRIWLAEDAQGRELRAHLTTAAHTWADAGQEDSELYRGARLSAALDWASTHDRHLNDLERTFLATSRQAGEREVERQRRSNRRLRGLLVGVALFLVVALVAGGVAVVQRSRARASNRAATAQRLGAQALQQDDLGLSLLLARQGVALYDSPVTDRNAALVSSPAAIKIVHPLPGLLGPATLSYDGSLFAVGNFRFEGAVIDTATYETVASLPGQPMAFSSDGRILVNRPGPATVSIIDPKTGERQDLDEAFGGESLYYWISPDFSELAMLAADYSTLAFWDTATLTRTGRIHAPSGQVFWDAAYTDDGRHLITVQQAADFTGPLSLVLRDAVTHRFEKTVTTTSAGLLSYHASRDGKWLVLGFQDGTVSVANVASGHKLVMSGRQDGAVGSLAISRDDTTVVSGGDDNAIKVWDLETGELRETLTGHAHWVSGVAISPDGGTLYSVSLDGSMIVWDLQGSHRLGRPFVASSGGFHPLDGYPPIPHLLSVSPIGGLFASSECDGKVVIRDVTTVQRISTIRAVTPVRPCKDRFRAPYDAVFTPDGHRVVVGGPSGQVTMFDARSGAPTGPALAGPKETIVDPVDGQVSDSVEAVAVSPDGKIVAAGTAEGRVYLWDAVTGRPTRSPIQVPDVKLGHTPTARNWVFDLGFNPDGTELVAGHGSAASVWSTSDWSLRYTVDVDDGAGAAYAAAFSPDGRTLATAGGITDLRLWDAGSGDAIGSVPVDTTYTISLGWSPDGSTIVTGGWDGSIKLVDVASRSVVGALPGPSHLFNSVAFTSDGSAVLVVYENGHGIRWEFDPAAWAQRACDVAGRTLTQDEWNRFLPGLPYDPACSSTTSG